MLSRLQDPPSADTLRSQLSTAFADTLASELGILSPSAPVYLLTLRPVPPGTNGGVSLYGLIASIVGGLLIGGVMVADLLVERAGCRADSGFAVDLIIFGVLSGFLGSLVSGAAGAYATSLLKADLPLLCSWTLYWAPWPSRRYTLRKTRKFLRTTQPVRAKSRVCRRLELAGMSSVTLPSTLSAEVLWPPSAGGGRVAEPTRGIFEAL